MGPASGRYENQRQPAESYGGRLLRLQAELDALKAEPAALRSPIVAAGCERMAGLWDSAADASDPQYPTVGVTGFFQVDAVWFSQDADSRGFLGDVPDAVHFRRARLAATGDVAPNVDYLVEFDFGFPGRPSFMDVWLTIHDLPGVGNARVGQWRQPFGMDNVTSVRELWFFERALPFAFAPFRQTGIGFFDGALDESATWAISGYKFPVDPFGGNFGDDGYGAAARATIAPWYDESTNEVVHFGWSWSHNRPTDERLFYRTTPEVGFTQGDFNTVAVAVPFFVDTGLLAAEDATLLGWEAAAARGPLNVQAELVYARVDQVAGPSLLFSSAYAQAAWVLTGERRPYVRSQGVFGRVVPAEDFGTCGCGAWELAARWSYIDLDDETITGGRLTDTTIGLNWYLNRYTRFAFNYIHAVLGGSAPHSQTGIAAVRGQLDF
ncbi:MAG: porin [Planctomycetes bacterium]|nr:porin [Planctomycetota bacterium]